MRKHFSITVALINMLAGPAWAGADMPSYIPASTCRIFGKFATQSCLDDAEETYAVALNLWRVADDTTRDVCKEVASESQKIDNRPYEFLSQCLSLRIGQKRLFAGSNYP